MPDRRDDYEALIRVARITHVEARVLYEWVQEEIVLPPKGDWDEGTIQEIQRVRRLTELGVNPEGIEVVLHMREELVRLRAEMAALERQLTDLQRRHERELGRLLRELIAETDWTQ